LGYYWQFAFAVCSPAAAFVLYSSNDGTLIWASSQSYCWLKIADSGNIVDDAWQIRKLPQDSASRTFDKDFCSERVKTKEFNRGQSLLEFVAP
jgi:hypothetical protein